MRHVVVPGVRFRAEALAGATASGLQNPNSATRSQAIFAKRLRRAKRWQHVLIQLGEVDCGFVIWHRAERHGLSVEEQLEQTLDSYQTFLEGIARTGFAGVIVLSVPLPTIDDTRSEWRGQVANLRKEVTATKLERTNLTLRFNSQLQARCLLLGIDFVDVTTGHLDPLTGLIDKRFLRRTQVNHHLAQGPYAELISEQLGRLWEARRRPGAPGAQPASRIGTKGEAR